jgi:hypothetical protein
MKYAALGQEQQEQGQGGNVDLGITQSTHFTQITQSIHKSHNSHKIEYFFWQILWNFLSKSHNSHDSHGTIPTTKVVVYSTETSHS